MKKQRKYKVHVISGTHWDREWRFTAEQSKLRLADLLDNLISLMEENENYRYFLLDGGTVILEDYQSVRPQNMGRLSELIKAGRIQLVNFYTLPDMFIVAPEAILRNLLIGQRVAKPYGGTMKFGYTATSYGQTSQLPQIYKGFGIDTAMFYRGANKYMPPCFSWEGADGTCILGFRCYDIVTRTNWFFYVHQPLVLNKTPKNLDYYFNPEEWPVHSADENGYQGDFHLMKESYDFKKDVCSLEQAYAYFMGVSKNDAIGPHITGLNMEDNQKPYPPLQEMIDTLNSVQEEAYFFQNSLDRYAEDIKSTIDTAKLEVVKGEIRRTAVEIGFNALLGAVISSRVNLKLLNEHAETELIHYAEPFASFAGILGHPYPALNLERAWKSLLQNHAHDSICGSAIDQAHKDMLYRFSEARMVGEEISLRSLELIWKHISFTCMPEGELILTFFNTLPFERSLISPVIFDLPLEFGEHHFDMFAPDGTQVSYETIWAENINMRCERELDTNAITFPAKRHLIMVPVKVPAMGYTSYTVKLREPRYVALPQRIGDRNLIAGLDATLENNHMKVTINPNGTFDLHDKNTDMTYRGLHYFTDSSEAAHAHITRKAIRDFTVSSIGCRAHIKIMENTPLRGVIKIATALEVPAEGSFDGRDRSKHDVSIPITTWLTLTRDAKILEIRTRLNNTARDHRLRVNLPTDLVTDYSYAESAFAVEKRSLIWTDTGDNFESHFPWQPMQNFVDVTDGDKGLAFINRGMREYEVMDDKRRTLAVTLLRTHRSYMTANEKMTPEEIDEHQGSHVPGELEFHYALYPHRGDWQNARVLNEAYSFKAPIRIIQGVHKKEGYLPAQHSFMKIEPAEHIHVSALKRAEEGDGYILRLWNSHKKDIKCALNFGVPISSLRRVQMDETGGKKIEVKDNAATLLMHSGEIATLYITIEISVSKTKSKERMK